MQKGFLFAGGGRFCGLCLCKPQGSGADEPEAKVVVPIVRSVTVPNGGMRVVGGIVKAAAAFHTVTASVFLHVRSPFLYSLFFELLVLASVIAAKTLLARSAAFSSGMAP